MSVSRAKKDERRRLIADQVRRVHADTGLTAFEQYGLGQKLLAPIHQKINRRELFRPWEDYERDHR
jgi:hypothetical protein